MDPAGLLAILQEQRAHRFKDIAGARAAVTLPVSDDLVSRLALDSLPPDGVVRDIQFRAQESNRFAVRVRLSRPAFLPSITLTLLIQRQPELPDSPFLVLKVETGGGLFGLAGPALRMMGGSLPPGLQLEGDRLVLDLRRLLDRYGAAEVLDYLRELQVTTEDRRFVISARGSVRHV